MRARRLEGLEDIRRACLCLFLGSNISIYFHISIRGDLQLTFPHLAVLEEMWQIIMEQPRQKAGASRFAKPRLDLILSISATVPLQQQPPPEAFSSNKCKQQEFRL